MWVPQTIDYINCYKYITIDQIFQQHVYALIINPLITQIMCWSLMNQLLFVYRHTQT